MRNKDHLRDYATNAFRVYAAAGCPTYEQMRQQVLDDVMNRSTDNSAVRGDISRPTEAMVLAAESRLDQAVGKLADIMAVIRALDQLKAHRDGEAICRCLKAVYFVHPFRLPMRGEISSRVRAAAEREYVDDRTVYRWLAVARKVFAVERGLNVVSSGG